MLKVLLASSEIVPFAKTGGLADVNAALPAALRAMQVDVRLLLPSTNDLRIVGVMSRASYRSLLEVVGRSDLLKQVGRGARTLGLVNVVGSTIAREDDGGVYLQDKYTFKRVTVSGGLRFDFFTRKKTVTSRWFSDGTVGKFFVEHGDAS